MIYVVLFGLELNRLDGRNDGHSRLDHGRERLRRGRLRVIIQHEGEVVVVHNASLLHQLSKVDLDRWSFLFNNLKIVG